MGERTGIAWTESTWNPVTGCSHVSAGCEHCYAETLSLRFGWSKKPWTAPNAAENVILHPERLDQPLKWRAPRRIFVNSMSDLFHEQIPFSFIDQVWAVMALAPDHIFQILTKRPERALLYFQSDPYERVLRRAANHRAWRPALGNIGISDPRHAAFYPNVWIGVSIEQDRWTGRADILRDVPAAVHFISAEPLLEALPSLDLSGIDWLIFGGESGRNARLMIEPCQGRTMDAICRRCNGTGWVPKPWALKEARRLRDLTHAVGGAYFHKQWGGLTPTGGGHLLDGQEYHEFPAVTL